VLKSIEELESAGLFVAMVQREVADRFAAPPGNRAYGVTSALAQIACDVDVVRKISPKVFHPEPKVQSALVRLRRTGPAAAPEVAALVHAAFAHRRKALPGSLALAPEAAPDLRDRARSGLDQLGLPADTRAERLGPEEFVALAGLIGPEPLIALRRSGSEPA
jgi:16S rRNA (adenine1518-N6/adenine1519-N6)-dimethyltransferase